MIHGDLLVGMLLRKFKIKFTYRFNLTKKDECGNKINETIVFL